MCVGGGGGRSYPQPQRPEFEDSPPVVTGSQTGVENPKDTKKATEELKIRRQKKEGTYVDPNLAAVEEKLSRSGGGLGEKEKSERSARLRSGVSRGPRPPSKAQKMAAARKAMKAKR